MRCLTIILALTLALVLIIIVVPVAVPVVATVALVAFLVHAFARRRQPASTSFVTPIGIPRGPPVVDLI